MVQDLQKESEKQKMHTGDHGRAKGSIVSRHSRPNIDAKIFLYKSSPLPETLGLIS